MTVKFTDRELDALVAERVMGWTRVDAAHEFSGWDYTDDPGSWEYAGSVGVGKYPGMAEVASPVPIPRYSSTGDGMLAVVEAMRGKGYDCKILLKDYAHVLFDDGDDDEEWTLADGPHWAHENVKEAKGLPHTVCLAALRALGVDVPA